MRNSYRAYLAFFLSILLLSVNSAFAQRSLLTPEQNAWLDKAKRTIVVNPQESDPPFVFEGSGTIKEIKGFSVEYLNAIARKLDLKIVFNDPAPLNQILANARERDEGIILSVTPTSEREQYLYFTDSYYDTPAVIAVRKDFISGKSVITLNNFSGKKVAVGDKYAVQSYIQTNYPNVNLISVTDDQTGLQKLLLGDVDAVVMDFASFSYYTSNDILSYIKMVGSTGFNYKHSIAVPKSSPELALILDKGIKSLSDSEKQLIINKWMSSNADDLQALSSTNLPHTSTNNITTWLIFISFIILIAATIILVLILQRRSDRNSRLLRKSASSDIKEEFEELKIAQETLKEDIVQLDEIEKDIEEKIKNIR